MGTFAIVADNLTVSGAKMLVFVRPNTSASLEILRVEVSNSGSATSTQARVQLVTQVSAFPTSTSATPIPFKLGETGTISGGTGGAAGTAGIDASSNGAGARTVLYAAGFNAPIGWAWVSGPDDRILMPASAAAGFGVYIPAAPTTTTGWHCMVVYREL
jgi:hypothetical protein